MRRHCLLVLPGPLSDGVATIRPTRPEDRAALVAGRDVEFYRFLGGEDREHVPFACIVAGDVVVGWVDYDHDRPWLTGDEVNVGYYLFPAYRGQGYATRAVRLLLQHLAIDTDWQVATLLIHPGNERSLALARRAGFARMADLDGIPYWKQRVVASADARLPHGYTNFTRRLPGGAVEKRYAGPARWDNARREHVCLRDLHGQLPVPRLITADLSVPMIVIAALGGRHGQQLIDEGHAVDVLRLVGATLRRLQAIHPASVPELAGSGPVIVHGDFGPQNMLFDLDEGVVVGVLDWESAHLGRPVEDLAWAEWLVRTHHPDAAAALGELHAAAGLDLPWADRQEAMVRQCRQLVGYCESSGMEEAAADWRRRLTHTEAWTE